MKTIFSGIQPTGNLHLGNYLGSVANWIDLQEKNKCIFGIMNLHAITVPQDPKELQKHVLDCAIIYLAAGLDPKKSIIFTQSTVKEHLELAWIFSCLTPMGWLNRMTQFKDKSKGQAELASGLLALVSRHALLDKSGADLESGFALQLVDEIMDVCEESQKKSSAKLGLYAYPDLMAADILLYKANLVPTGEDQKQHVELTRDIAGAFNRLYKKEYFTLPEPMIMGNCTRIMSLQDGSNKMSKSEESDLSRINLSDGKDLIIKKVKKCKTDSIMGISYDKDRPEIYNLLNIFAACSGKKPEEIAIQYADSGFGKFKEDLAQSIVNKLSPIQQKIADLNNNLDYVNQILKQGQAQAQQIASANMKEIKDLVGLC